MLHIFTAQICTVKNILDFPLVLFPVLFVLIVSTASNSAQTPAFIMDHSTISLQELTRIENLPMSVEEVCSKYKLFTLKDFLDYWSQHGSFSGLDDCDHNMEIVLSFVANKYALMPVLIKENLRGEEAVPLLIRRLDNTAKIMLCQLIAVVTSDYAPRIKGLLVNYGWSVKNNEGLFEFLYGDKCNFLNSDLTASVSSKITQLKNRITSILPMLATNSSKGVSDTRQHLLGLLPPNSGKKIFAPQKGVSGNDKIALFKLIDLLIEGGLVLDEKEMRYFSKLFFVMPEKNKNGIAAVSEAGYDQEMKDFMREYFQSLFLCLSFLQTDDLADYDLDLYNDVMVIDQAFVNRINTRESVHFTRHLYVNVLASVFEPKYCLLDGINAKQDKRRTSRKQYAWKASYLIKKEFAAMFNFMALVNEFEKYITAESTSGHNIDVEALIKEQLSEKDMRHIHRIKKICLVLLSHEFGLTENKQGQIIIPPSISLHYKTIFAKILDSFKLPATLSFLLARLKEIEPHAKLQLVEIRSALMADTEKFFCVGETDSFGLVEWRRSGKKFRTLSLETIAIEFLTRADTPMYTDDILSYIRRFRLITPSELDAVLKKPGASSFIVFKNDIVGLKQKNYAGEIVYVLPIKISSNK
ncbi:hypothetical protein FRZ67_19435 [Panacibacter ginsenosidivorans]|uniref:Uncharacterized protein n=1 Tax=Panacibacter ginsenosidivorans TaxID=1813871 RepID=A0A5B8VEG9_9BACT|nr:hypothetical protein [Panacibacter ginsenosidivorans]QEC69371.1 hypothetical protein FRZ67_19435 [Panacibacter ginsenosidivorans]